MRYWKRASILTVALLAVLMAVAPTAGAIADRTVKGKVTLKTTGEPVVGVTVWMVSEPDAQGDTIRHQVCTNDKGMYKFKNVDTRRQWTLTVASVRLSANPDCPNSAFKPPSGKKAMLRYDHPGHHGEWLEDASYFNVPEGSGAFRINIKLRTAKYTCYDWRATHHGTSGDDTIIGTSGTDIITGRGGNDIIEGRGGLDILCGDGGNDTLKGKGDFDLLLGGSGKKDKMIGGSGHDFCVDTKYKRADCEDVFPR